MSDNSSTDEDFIKAFRHLVEATAWRAKRQLGLTCELEDLVAFGYTGLLDARQRYDVSRGTPFRTFADRRIYGAIVDGVRHMAYLPRRAHARLKAADALQAATESLTEQEATRRRASDAAQLSEPSSLSAAQALNSVLGQVAAAYAIAATQDSSQYPRTGETPEEQLLRKQHSANLHLALSSLSEREQYLIRGHYFEGRSLDELAQEVGFSKSWASRLHGKALLRLRQALRDAKASKTDSR